MERRPQAGPCMHGMREAVTARQVTVPNDSPEPLAVDGAEGICKCSWRR